MLEVTLARQTNNFAVGEFCVAVSSIEFSRAIYSGAEGLFKGQDKSLSILKSPSIEIDNHPLISKLDITVTVLSCQSLDIEKKLGWWGKISNFAYDLDAEIWFKEPRWIRNQASFLEYLGQERHGFSVEPSTRDPQAFRLIKGDQLYGIRLGSQSESEARRRVIERGAKVLLDADESEWQENKSIEALKRVMSGERLEGQQSLFLASTRKPVEVVQNDMQTNVNFFAEAIEVIVNGLTTSQCTEPVNELITLAPPTLHLHW